MTFVTLRTRSPYQLALVGLFVLHLLCSTAYLRFVPGLLGDEGSEGENVFTLLDTHQLTVVGERSYIGPFLDYVRIPFVYLVGYNALSLRLVILLFSIATFWLAAAVFKRWFGETASLYLLALLFFSPIYLLYQRLGWAITLIPFFILATAWLLSRRPFSPSLALLAGLVTGLGLHNHFIFLPSLVAITAVALLAALRYRAAWNKIWPALIGFWAAFGTQIAVLLLQRDDQGQPVEVAMHLADRWQAFWPLVPRVLSGSAYVGLYTGSTFSAISEYIITAIIFFFIIAALTVSTRRRASLIVAGATVLHLLVLVVMIDRYAVRYVVPAILSCWALAGYGVYTLLARLKNLPASLTSFTPVALSLVLILCTTFTALVPYLRSGGSTNQILLTTNRSEPAAAFVDIRPLLGCLTNAGEVTTDSVHIYNRLAYLEHGRADFHVAENNPDAQWLVSYREPAAAVLPHSKCPELRQFQVIPYTPTKPLD